MPLIDVKMSGCWMLTSGCVSTLFSTLISELWNKTWHVFRVTPLYNFKKKQSDFKYYSSTLSSHVAAVSNLLTVPKCSRLVQASNG